MSSLAAWFRAVPSASRFRRPLARRARLAIAALEDRAVPAAFTFTSDADFDGGTLLNVNHNSPNNDQLQLNESTTPFPFINVAASGRGTMVRIDVNTGQIIGEYFSAPNGMGRDPSRTTVDQFGNVWLSNRAEQGLSGGQNKGSVTRVALVIGGIRGNKDGAGNFVPDPNGQYVKDPTYSTAIDRDGDGLIKTSRGLGNVLPWSNAGGANTHGGVSTAEDEAIINYVRVTGTLTRTIAIDANNDVWVGGLGDRDHEKIDGATGLPVPGTQFTGQNIPGLGSVGSGYGGVVDGNNVLWSASGGGQVLRYDADQLVTNPLAFSRVNTNGGYGIAVDPATGNIWTSSYGGGRVAVHNPTGTQITTYSQGNAYTQGLAFDGAGNVWLAHSLNNNTVGHLRTDGSYVGTVPLNTGLGSGQGPTGVAVDANGKVWVTNYYTHNVMRIDPNAGPIGAGGHRVGAVDMVVNLGSGAFPYNYSDMTGAVSIGTTSPQGTWNKTVDSGETGTAWGTASWTADVPAGGDVIVEVRAADTQAALASQLFMPVANGLDFVATGRFIEIRTTLKAGDDGTSPVLLDLTVQTANEPPTDIFVTPDSVPENQPAGTEVGPLSAVDVDLPDDTHTFEIVSGPNGETYDNECFAIVDGKLVTAAVLNQETHSTLNVRVKVTDAAGESYEEVLTITVADAAEGSLACGTVGGVNWEYDPAADLLKVVGRSVADTIVVSTANVPVLGPVIVLTANGSSVTFDGTGGNPVIYANHCNHLQVIDVDAAGAGDSITLDLGHDAYERSRLEAAGGNNTVTGGSGDDVIHALGGVDVLDGRGGSDTYRFTGAEGRLDEIHDSGTTGTDTVDNDWTLPLDLSGFGPGSRVTGIEVVDGSGVDGHALAVRGDGNGNVLDFRGATLKNVTYVDGRGGNDVIYASDDPVANSNGDPAFEGYFGDAGADSLFGGDAADNLFGEGGADYVRGGAGDDVVGGNAGTDDVDGEAGSDTYVAYATEARLDLMQDSGPAADTDALKNVGLPYQAPATTHLDLSSFGPQPGSKVTGIEVVDGGGFAVRGDAGANTLDFRGATLVNVRYVDGADGNDTIYASHQPVVNAAPLPSFEGYFGDDGSDSLYGGDADDRLFGEAGNDRLEGGGGSDLLVGGLGSLDSLLGGTGTDVFYLGDLSGPVFDGDADDDLIDDDEVSGLPFVG